jgi:hypothetical protein
VKVPERPRTPVKKAEPAESKPVALRKDSMRAEWFVDATRNGKEMTFPAPEGEGQANRIRDAMIGHGWEAKAILRNTFRDDPRFHEQKG